MCACGCFLVLALGAALAFCILHSLWLPAAGVIAIGALIGWLGFKMMQKSGS